VGEQECGDGRDRGRRCCYRRPQSTRSDQDSGSAILRSLVPGSCSLFTLDVFSTCVARSCSGRSRCTRGSSRRSWGCPTSSSYSSSTLCLFLLFRRFARTCCFLVCLLLGLSSSGLLAFGRPRGWRLRARARAGGRSVGRTRSYQGCWNWLRHSVGLSCKS
jgi:hypothetical protein